MYITTNVAGSDTKSKVPELNKESTIEVSSREERDYYAQMIDMVPTTRSGVDNAEA